jgi:polygalacturonase
VLLAASTPGYDVEEDPPAAYAAFQDHGHAHWRNAMIAGVGLHDVAIEAQHDLGQGLGRGHEYDIGAPVSGKPGVGDKAIALKLCRNVTLRDFKVLEGMVRHSAHGRRQHADRWPVDRHQPRRHRS